MLEQGTLKPSQGRSQGCVYVWVEREFQRVLLSLLESLLIFGKGWILVLFKPLSMDLLYPLWLYVPLSSLSYVYSY